MTQATVREWPRATADELDEAAEVLRGREVAVLTGAGVSTDSGIPDYRGDGAPPRNPMTFQQFLADPDYRKRYWVGSHLGWRRFDGASPNSSHRRLAELEAVGVVNGIITQNVDGLHLRAGSQRVVDLHGTMDRVRCLTCGQTYARTDVAERMTRANPLLDEPESFELGPDGDVAYGQIDDFVTPDCTVCGGILKPDIVFFGEFIPTEKFTEASALIRSAGALLIAGSSLVVNSGIRLLDQAAKRRIPVVIINRGVTKGDSRATVKIDAGTSETLTELAGRLSR
ncbi:Sir2 family NAD-dependent protein deacetylase [Lacisediminihabitans sp.]|uniref:Sir2 family NAD-dependent protein deacetylase n=1 Tax=Lacisediminihabitans sp. TaxID=2787631 RepID=UPI002F95A1D3